jgi:hypothetical protein
MTQLIRRPDGMRYVDSIEARTSALERRQAGELESRLVAVETDVAVKGRLIDVQRMFGTIAAYRAFTATSGTITVDSAGTTPMQLSYTPDVDCWWEVDANVGLIDCTATAYNYLYITQIINIADEDGFTSATSQLMTQRTDVNKYGFRKAIMTWKLAAGNAYIVNVNWSTNAVAGWQYYCSQDRLHIIGKAWAR